MTVVSTYKPPKVKAAVHRCRFVHYLSPSVVSIAMSTGPEKILAVGRANGTIQLWNPKGKTWFHERTIPSTLDPLEVVVWVGNRLFSAGLSGSIIEYNIKTLLPESFTPSYGGAVWSMQVNPSQDVIAIGCEDGMIRLFKITDEGLEYISALERQKTKVLSLAWHPVKPILVVGSTDGTIRSVHVDTGRTINTMKLDTVKGEHTVVWDVLILKDGTIVSGDSLGNVTFWNGKTGTLVKKLIAHEADVLCLTASKDGTRVFSSGVDRKLVQFSKVNTMALWVISGKKRYHTHDVRAMAYIEERPWDTIVTGGVDTSVVFIGPTADFQLMKQLRLGYFPQQSPISFSSIKRLLMCMFDDSVRVWRFAKAPPNVAEATETSRLPHEPHQHILTINLKGHSNLIASDISDDGSFICTSDTNRIKMFQIETDGSPVTVGNFTHPVFDSLPGSFKVSFTPDSKKLIVVGIDAKIYVVDLGLCEIINQFDFYDNSSAKRSTINSLAISSDSSWIVVGDCQRRLVSFSLTEPGVKHVLPTFSYPHTSITFEPATTNVAVTTSDNLIYIVDVSINRLTPWSAKNSHRLPKKFVNRRETISGIVFPKKEDHMLVWGMNYTYVIDLTKDIDETTEWKLNHRFQSLMACTSVESEIVVVERPVLQILSELPDAFKKRKYGR
ncbi:WD40-repeat-containing domain protein [Globomyces pollinis-pini]|nr:WD40-repeat-containing domain protein [Globomyces pollinis-pini]